MFFCQLPAHSPVPRSALPKLAKQIIAPNGEDAPRQLRTVLTQRYEAPTCVLVSSGAHALQIALSIAKRASHAPVLLPAYTCYEVATAAVGAQVKVALYDVDAVTLEPNWESVRSAGARGAAALVVAPLYGMPVDWDAASEVARQIGALLIADVAQAHGTTWQGKPAGSVGDMIVLSFGRGKGWTGSGGGALLSRNSALLLDAENATPAAHGYKRIAEATSVARAGSQWLLGRRSLYGLPRAIPFLNLGETVYHAPTSPGSITHTSAALLLASEPAAAAEVLHRRRNAREYTQALSEGKKSVKSILGARMGDESGALRFPVLVTGGWSSVRHTYAPRLGAAGGYPTTLREIAALGPLLTNGAAHFKDSETIVRELVTLPTHSQTASDERQRLVKIVSA
jgi:dTDP-4-amino-4,6-dideoxygalactose transaminase